VVVVQRKDATAVEILTTSSPTTPRRTSTPPTSTTPASARTKCEYTSKHKSKGAFDKEALKKYFKKVKAQERAFLTSLSDLDNDTDDDWSSSSPSSDDESEKGVRTS
jgi:hypothetical protein